MFGNCKAHLNIISTQPLILLHLFNHIYDWLRDCKYTNGYAIDSGVDRFKRQFAHLEEGGAKGEKTSPQLRQHASLPRQ